MKKPVVYVIIFFCNHEKNISSVKINKHSLFPSREKKIHLWKKSKQVSVKTLDSPWKGGQKCTWKRLFHPWKKSKNRQKWLSRALLLFTGKQTLYVNKNIWSSAFAIIYQQFLSLFKGLATYQPLNSIKRHKKFSYSILQNYRLTSCPINHSF